MTLADCTCDDCWHSWRKSSHSRETACVEAGHDSDHIAIRDTNDRDGVVLVIPVAAWRAFTRKVSA